MASSASVELTQLLQSWRAGQNAAMAGAFELAYEELKRIAAQRLHQSQDSSTLSPTALLHEAYLRIAEGGVVFENRAHFFAGMSLYIRSALVDHARARQAAKRGGGEIQVSLSESLADEESMVAEVLALDQSLTRLAALDPRCANVLHLNCFASLDRQQIADVLKLSLATVDRDLRFARAWVHEELKR
jgi:RNA polymerase sigma factor (TIGR02999 family)